MNSNNDSNHITKTFEEQNFTSEKWKILTEALRTWADVSPIRTENILIEKKDKAWFYAAAKCTNELVPGHELPSAFMNSVLKQCTFGHNTYSSLLR